ncbi:MAG: polysaccharide biosynthesis tyrosine autokinase [Eubacterium sp.]|nr:polysaccharide biosynthesis tyrosine autokinase [Eubacterium sp.]
MNTNERPNNINLNKRTSAAQDADVINLVELAKQLFTPRNVIIIVLVGMFAGIFSFLYSKYAMPELYTSSVMVYVSNNSSITISDGIDSQTITGSRGLAESGVIILKSDYVMEQVGDELISIYADNMEKLEDNFILYETSSGTVKIKPGSLAACYTVAPIDETEVLSITAVTKSPTLSADLCNILAEVAPESLKSVVGGGTVEAIGEAQIPTQKSSPNNTKNALMGCIAGVVITGGIFVFLILMDNKIRNSESFKAKFDYPVFEEIPYIESEKTDGKKKIGLKRHNKEDDDDLMNGIDSMQSFRLSEIFNTLGNNLMVALTMNDEKVVVVSSPDENDGKSTVSVNLACAMAKLGKKVLLIDMDLRKGSLHKKIKMANKNGVIDIIGKNADFDSCVKKNVASGLDVLLTGGVSPNSMGILSSKKTKLLIDKCKERYDFVVIDSPPVNVVGDACVISQYAAGMIIVVRANSTSFDDIKKLIENVRLANGKIMGFVINFAELYAKGYSYYKRKGYGYGYGYGYYGAAKAVAEQQNKQQPKNNAKA